MILLTHLEIFGGETRNQRRYTVRVKQCVHILLLVAEVQDHVGTLGSDACVQGTLELADNLLDLTRQEPLAVFSLEE